MNNNFYTSPLSPEETRQRFAMQQQQQQQQNAQQTQGRVVQGQEQGQGHGQGVVGMVDAASLGGLEHTSPLSAMEGMPLTGDGSLDDIISQNTREFQRRRSVPQPFSGSLSPQDVDRRMSLMGFDNSGDPLQGFSFGFSSSAALSGTSGPFSQQGLMDMPGQTGFGPLAPGTVGMDAFPTLDMGSMGADPASMSLFNSPDLSTQYPPAPLDPVSPEFAMDMGVDTGPLSATSVTPVAGFAVGVGGGMLGAGIGQFQPSMPPPEPREASVPASFRSPTSTASRAASQSSASRSSIAAATPSSTAPSAIGPRLPAGLSSRDPKKDVYSKSGFDMLRALFYVATRKNPTVEIGAVDLSCAFVVCDVTLNDCPIIYVSDNFQNLTGYNRHEIVGKNCRFLQSPDGIVEAGSKREFVANDAVFKLKNAIADGKEIQQSLINYRKGGKPFLNLLTMIPIPWDSDEIRYNIGFQIDLVECPEAISGQESGGMSVNYKHSEIDRYIWTPPNSTQFEPDSGQTLGVDEVSSLIQQHNPKAAPTEWHRQSWDKMLLENADDVVHVLSLKGLFLYLSPACKRLLEYDPSDLVGTALSSICHPSDIVPVTRELKDAHQNASVNIAFRIRRKHSGYMWFESHGTLFCEQPPRGRKYIILVGRKRPVFSLRRRDVEACSAGLGSGVAPPPSSPVTGGDSEVWSKVSTAGMFLFVSSTARSLLDLLPRDLEGTSMQDLMRKESRPEFGRTIEKARKGAVVGFRHEVLHKRGHFVPAQTVFYPGDGGGGGRGAGLGKPSFLIAQTRLVKGAGRVIAAGKGGGSGSSAAMIGLGVTGAGEDPMAGVVMSNSPLALTTSTTTTTTMTVQPYPDSATDTEEEDDVFAELRTTRCTSWQYELRQMEKVNRLLAEELTQLMTNKKKRKRRKGGGGGGGGGGNGSGVVRDCANCHKRETPEWRRGPSGNRDLCNSCGLRWAKQTGKVSPRNTSRANSDASIASKRTSVSTASTNSPVEASPLRREVSLDEVSVGSGGLERGSVGDASGTGSVDMGMGMGSIREE